MARACTFSALDGGVTETLRRGAVAASRFGRAGPRRTSSRSEPPSTSGVSSSASGRLPVMRRALEMIGQTLSGSTGVQAQADYLRWAMDRAWAHSVRSCLEAGAWNFASKRCYFKTGNAAV
jgi:hypothetical protein